MPAGSLANPTRGGNLVDLLAKAGFPAKGYDAGGPTDFTSVNFLFGWDGRPQEFCTQLALNELDIAIAGDDWMQERILEMKMAYGIELAPEKVLSLHRGNINLVGIVDGSFPESTTEEFLTNLIKRKDQITVVTELPYMALNWIMEKLKKIGAPEKFQKWSIQKYKTPAKEGCGIVIYETWGKTEAKLKNGGADIGLEITQSGSALRNYGLKILEWVFSSETGIWISKDMRKSAAKMELLKLFLINLYGIINAENKVMFHLAMMMQSRLTSRPTICLPKSPPSYRGRSSPSIVFSLSLPAKKSLLQWCATSCLSWGQRVSRLCLYFPLSRTCRY